MLLSVSVAMVVVLVLVCERVCVCPASAGTSVVVLPRVQGEDTDFFQGDRSADTGVASSGGRAPVHHDADTRGFLLSLQTAVQVCERGGVEGGIKQRVGGSWGAAG